jgi:hypothetical protein
MPPELFTLAEARALQGHLLYATQDFKDEFDRLVVPQTAVCKVVGVDSWDQYDAVLVVQFPASLSDVTGDLTPKIVVLNKTGYAQYFEDVSLVPVEAE